MMQFDHKREKNVMRKKGQKATHLEMYKVGKLIEEFIVEVDGGCEYKDGYSDQHIAKEIGVSVESVKRLRQDMYGVMQSRPPTITHLSCRLDNLIKAFNVLAERLGENDLHQDD